MVQAFMDSTQLVEFSRLNDACNALPTSDLLVALGGGR